MVDLVDFLNRDDYAAYVWAAWGVTLVGLIVPVFLTLRTLWHYEAELAALKIKLQPHRPEIDKIIPPSSQSRTKR